ncbi:MAG: hypothetical protein QGG67_01600 [Gammaproteobacteria bacterium]|nr:hypothetical protein [Gammaproteobacteria bacterium]MBQ15354.1 hypothetical protein [Gammaproteobacteria bacterium]MDP6094680.1 hypothetical protein [Gammaproteobacteria bacterium]
MTEDLRIKARTKLWPQLRALLIFQLKLYLDAFRDIFLSVLSIGAFIIDLVLQNSGAGSLFERVLSFGRRTERAINLFNQYDPEQQRGGSIDSILKEVEDRWENRE